MSKSRPRCRWLSMKARHLVFLVFWFPVAIAYAQNDLRSQVFHVEGAVRDPAGAVVPRAKVVFRSGSSETTIATNETGFYEVDLPLGTYTMTAKTSGFITYKRPLFRMDRPGRLVFDVGLQLQECGDMVIGNSSGRPVTDAEIYAATESCRPEDLFRKQARDGTPFEISIRRESHTKSGNTYRYDAPHSRYHAPVSVAYNVFSLHADHVSYNPKQNTLEATGNVIVEDESGKQEYDSVTFKLENGRASRQR